MLSKQLIITSLLHSAGLWNIGYFGTPPALAQTVMGDGTVGTVVVGNGPFTVTGGTQQTTTLFHSFSDFSPGDTNVLFQLNSRQSTVDTVVSRVTGNQASWIDAQLSLSGGNSPDFFLINPNGITFGQNANLSMPGSFFASTAEAVLFENNVTFSAVNPQPAPLLTMSSPIGLQMGNDVGDIQVNNNGHLLTQENIFSPVSRPVNPSSLTVPTGEALVLIGNHVNLNGGILIAETGHIELAAVEQGQVEFHPTNVPGRFTYAYDDIDQFGTIALVNQSLVDTSQSITDTDGGGSITLVGQDIQLADASVVLVQNIGTQAAGDIQVRAEGTLAVTGTRPFDNILTGFKNQNVGSGEGGNLELQVGNLSVTQGAEVEAATYGVADGGNVVINASGTVHIEGFSPESPDSSSTISTITVGSGDAGELKVQANRLNIKNGGNLISFNFFNPFFAGSGNSGDVTINVAEAVEISGDNFITNIPSSLTAVTLSNGDGGNLAITTPQLSLTDGGRIGTTTFADGDAGDLTVVATEAIQLKGVGSSEFNPSMIIASANIQDPFIRRLFGLPDVPSGESGEILIQTPRLDLSDGAQVNVQNDGTGDSGDLMVEGDFISLNGGSGLTAATLSGEGGNIRLSLDSILVLRDGSQLSSEARGSGNGGNISIDSPIILGIENSDIVANAVTGNGGNISITSQGILGLKFSDFLTPGSDMTASSQFGVNGTVTITNFNNDIAASFVELPSKLDDPTNQITTCGTGENKLVMTGRGGVPQQPSDLLSSSHRTWQDLRTVPREGFVGSDRLMLENSARSANAIPMEANQWRIGSQGNVEFYLATRTYDRTIANCAQTSRS